MSNDAPKSGLPLRSAALQRPMPVGRRFQPGQSGNPGGKAPIIRQIRDLARQHTAEAIEGLLAIGRKESATDAARVAAWEAILDRGWGKAPQKYEVEMSIFESMSPEARAVIEQACDILMQEMRP